MIFHGAFVLPVPIYEPPSSQTIKLISCANFKTGTEMYASLQKKLETFVFL